jgi:hypothetical protein
LNIQALRGAVANVTALATSALNVLATAVSTSASTAGSLGVSGATAATGGGSDWLVAVSAMLPQLTASVGNARAQLTLAQPAATLTPAASAVTAALTTVDGTLCSGQVATAHAALVQAVALVEGAPILQGALGPLTGLLTTLNSSRPALGALQQLSAVTATMGGPSPAGRAFLAAVTRLRASTGGLGRVSDSGDALQRVLLSAVDAVTHPILTASALAPVFVNATRTLLRDPVFAHTLATLQGELDALYAGVSQYTGDAATVRDVVKRIIRVVDKFPSLAPAGNLLREGVNAIQVGVTCPVSCVLCPVSCVLCPVSCCRVRRVAVAHSISPPSSSHKHVQYAHPVGPVPWACVLCAHRVGGAGRR